MIVVEIYRDKNQDRIRGADVQEAEKLAERVPWISDPELRAEAVETVGRYVSATSAAEMVPLVVDGGRLEQLMSQWFSNEKISTISPQNMMIDDGGIERLQGNWWKINVIQPVLNEQPLQRKVLIRIAPSRCRVDWMGSEGIGALSWDEFFLRRPQRGVEMRVLAKPGTVILSPDEQRHGYRKVSLSSSNERQTELIALIEPGSELERELIVCGVLSNEAESQEGDDQDALDQPKLAGPVHLSLLLRFPEERRTFSRGRELVEISEIQRTDWLVFADDQEKEGTSTSPMDTAPMEEF